MGAYKRTNPGDVANSFVRCMLCDLSSCVGTFTDEEQKATLEFFDYKCPYTGEDIREEYECGNCELDHLIPQNRASCGLHVYGNLVYTTPFVNRKKRDLPFDKFILEKTNGSPEEKQARIDKIKRFVEESGYNVKVSRLEEIKKYCQQKYQETQDLLQVAKREICEITGVPVIERPNRNTLITRNVQSCADVSLEEFFEWLGTIGLSSYSVNNYKTAMRRILEDAGKTFDDFFDAIPDEYNKYLRGGEKAALGDVYSGAGRAVLGKLLDYFLLKAEY